MPHLSFAVVPGQVGKLHGLLSCLVKFDENISIEARPSSLRISSLNSSKSAHASFTLESGSFLVNYHFRASNVSSLATRRENWSCTLQNRALLSIFKKRNTDGGEKEWALERCEFELRERTDETDCRLIVRLICRQGVVKTYRLTYEPANVLSANFDSTSCPNYWSTTARTLRDTAEYFGAKADHLDWTFENGKVNFISYTEKISDGRDIFKQPMQTSVAIERKDFTNLNLQQDLRIGILVRDFRAIVSHADGLGVIVTARYSRGNRPLQIVYEDEGLLCDFTLMTRDRSGNSSSTGSAATYPPVGPLSVRPVGNQQSPHTLRPNEEQRARRPAAAQTTQPSMTSKPVKDAQRSSTLGGPVHPANKAPHLYPNGTAPAPSATLQQDSLFFPAGEDETFWDDDDDAVERDDFITWDASERGAGLSQGRRLIRDNEISMVAAVHRPLTRDVPDVEEIGPTQRLSQLKGLFD